LIKADKLDARQARRFLLNKPFGALGPWNPKAAARLLERD
jgi:hypothetical protein